jgi:hypothetical protein
MKKGYSENYDISLLRMINKSHGFYFGFWLSKFNSRLDFLCVDDIGKIDTLRIGVGNSNKNINLGYRFSKSIASKWRYHLNLSSIYAFNGKSDFYFKDHHFSVFFKPGIQFVSQYGLVVECNGVLMHSPENISMFESGSFIPLQWGLDLRIGKEF